MCPVSVCKSVHNGYRSSEVYKVEVEVEVLLLMPLQHKQMILHGVYTSYSTVPNEVDTV